MSEENQNNTQSIKYGIWDILFRRNFINADKGVKKKRVKKEIFEWIFTACISIAVTLLAVLVNPSDDLSFFQCYKNFSQQYAAIISLLGFSTKIFLNITRDLQYFLSGLETSMSQRISEQLINHVESINQKVEKVSDKVDSHLKQAKIVFETGIKDYDDEHLIALKKLLNSLDNKNVKKIYAIDNSDSIQWWSDTMTGYMALLANWKSKMADREVHRIFIYSKNELLSPLVTKTLALHSLMGFKTYVYSEEKFTKKFEEFVNTLTKPKIKKKEILIWEDPINNLANCNIEQGTQRWQDICFFQSFWDIDSLKEIRSNNMKDKEYAWKNYHDSTIKSQDIKIWFEFIPKSSLKKLADNWDETPVQYLGFINNLISEENIVCCNHQNDLIRSNGIFGIEIKTTGDQGGQEFMLTTNEAIRGILKVYHNK